MIFVLFLLVGLVAKLDAFATPSSDFLLGIDGSSVACGHDHVCALEQRAGNNIGGRARCWGSEHREEAMESPKDMDFVQLVAGMDFTCGMTPEQTVFCWGRISGYLPGLFEQITASGFANTVCGVLTDGKIYCFGYSTLPSLTPKDAAERFVQISCSRDHCCVLDSNAYPHCWGEASQLKEIYPPTITHSQYLTAISGPGVDMSILQTTAASQDALKRKRSLDDEDFESDPSASADAFTVDTEIAKIQYRQISVGEGLSCGITLLGAHLQCWGGPGKRSIQSPRPYRQVSVGKQGVCAITGNPDESGADSSTTPNYPSKPVDKNPANRLRNRDADKLHCWGVADALVHYSGSTDAEDLHWDQISVGYSSVCAVTMDSELRCWGITLPEEVTDRPPSFYVA